VSVIAIAIYVFQNSTPTKVKRGKNYLTGTTEAEKYEIWSFDAKINPKKGFFKI